jgi:alpha-tubulin suppressor-like RCC1 family protein
LAIQLQLRKGNTTSHTTFTGALAEVTVDTSKKTVVVHDGTTAGGYPLALKTDIANINSNVAVLTTANIAESGNLYFTNTRAINAFTEGTGINIDANGLISSTVTGGGAVDSVNGLTGTVVLTTANVTEDTNLYYTNARVYSNVTQLGYITTSSLNGYATNTQLSSYALTSDLTTSNVIEGANLYFTNTRAINAFTEGTGINIDANGLISSTVTGDVISVNGLTGTVVLTTANIAESGNLYFTDARVSTAISNQTLSNATFSGALVVGGEITAKAIGGDEGGQINLANAQTNSTLSGQISLDIYQNKLRIFETGGSNRGVYIDLSTVSSGVGTNLIGGGSGTITEVAGVPSGAVSNIQLAAGIAQSGILTTSNVTEGTNLYFTNARSIAALSAGQNITIDANGRINSTATGGGGGAVDSVNGLTGTVVLTTANIAESGNLYFTNARSIAALSAGQNITIDANGRINTEGAAIDPYARTLAITALNGATDPYARTLANTALSQANVLISVSNEGTLLTSNAISFNFTGTYVTATNVGGAVTVDIDPPPVYTAWSWGCNANYQLGELTQNDKSSPVSLVNGFCNWSKVSAGGKSSHAIRQDGTAWGWGYNNVGQLGDGTVAQRSSFVSVVGGFTDWCQISAGYNHVLAVRTNGTAWAWGCGYKGILGDDTTVSKSSPVSVVGGFTDWCQVSAGRYLSVGVRQNGSAWAWGANFKGGLGDNTTVSRSSPVSVVGGFTDWCQIDADNRIFSIAVRQNGTIWTWGGNYYGFLGDNTIVSRSSPGSVVGGFTDWCQVSAGAYTSLGLRTNGTAWTWGRNDTVGRLGDGTTVDKSSPVSVVGGYTDWCQVSAGQQRGLALRTNGTAWTWGQNAVGRLGDGTTVNRSSPVSVAGGCTDWLQVSATGSLHSIGIRLIQV